MSGGVAYVYDPTGVFPGRVNPEMVALEELDDDDRRWLHERVEKHRHETGSDVAGRLLQDWDHQCTHFVKIMPTDYRRVLEAAAQARARGEDEVEAVMAASRG